MMQSCKVKMTKHEQNYALTNALKNENNIKQIINIIYKSLLYLQKKCVEF